MKNFIVRILSSIVFLGVVGLGLFPNENSLLIFKVLWTGLLLLSLGEFFSILISKTEPVPLDKTQTLGSPISPTTVPLSKKAILPSLVSFLGVFLSTFTVAEITVMLTGFLNRRDPKTWIKYVAFGCLSQAFITQPLTILLYLRENHVFHIYLCLAVGIGSDTGGYLFGHLSRIISRFIKSYQPYLIVPFISPHKTLEGSLGGFIGSLILCYVLSQMTGFSIPWMYVPAMTLMCQIGDLLESGFKRSLHVKDSGSLIPGHGGILDRIDGYLLLLPFYETLVRSYVETILLR
jgi:CDP-diglyceride synthetase